MEFRIGCSGWSYSGWMRFFYPSGTRPGDYLRLYSRVFNTVEIDSTFYRIPGQNMVKGWKDSTPEDFIFTAKLPGEITHENRLSGSGDILERFISAIKPLGRKLGLLLFQFPPSLTREKGFEPLKSIISVLPSDLKFAVEFRHFSWFGEDVFSILSENSVTLAWSEVQGVPPAKALTTDTVYLRLVGDRSIPEEKFGTVQKDRSGIIKSWAEDIQKRRDEVRHAFVFANNHFQGFGPFTVNLFRQSAGMEPVDWGLKMRSIVPDRQKTLF